MPDDKKEEFDFIQEKIKHKPVNKKKLLLRAVKTAGLGLLFGAAACLAFTLLRPVLEDTFYKQDGPVFTIPKDENSELSEQWQTEQTESEQPKPQEPDTQIIEVLRELEVEDYQKLQNKLYAIGAAANWSIVTVTGVKSDLDWFQTPYETAGSACGIILGDNAQEVLVMTPKKVIADAETIHVTFYNGEIAEAALKQSDGNTGIAVLSVPVSNLDETLLNLIKPAELGNSYRVSQGDIVIAVGSPLGSNYSILTGNITSTNNVVSAIDSSFTVFTTDIVGSSSGSGALLNLEGEIVGLIMQDYGNAGEENTMTALSISELKEIIEQLSNNRSISYLGLKVSTVTHEIEQEYDLPRGVYIKSVEMDSPALAAGLQNGDVIVSINGQEMLTADQYEQYVRKLEVGSPLEIVIMRQGNEGYNEISCHAQTGVL